MKWDLSVKNNFVNGALRGCFKNNFLFGVQLRKNYLANKLKPRFPQHNYHYVLNLLESLLSLHILSRLSQIITKCNSVLT